MVVKPRQLTWPHVDAWCKPILHLVDFELPLPLGQLCSFFIDAKSSFVWPRGEAGSQYSFRHFLFIYANFYMTAHLSTTVIQCVSPILAFFVVYDVFLLSKL